MVLILLSAARVATSHLQVAVFVAANPNLVPSWRNYKAANPLQISGTFQRFAIGPQVLERSAAANARKTGLSVIHVTQAGGFRGSLRFITDLLVIFHAGNHCGDSKHAVVKRLTHFLCQFIRPIMLVARRCGGAYTNNGRLGMKKNNSRRASVSSLFHK